ncbi:MAG: hypothetical protein Q9172_004724 [Xanthocarpia lactea]
MVDIAVSLECAKRWGYALDPGLSHTPWTEEQDERLIRAINEHGHDWTKISGTTFQDRSTVNIKNRYQVIKRQQQSRSSSDQLASPLASSTEDENFPELRWTDGDDEDDHARATLDGDQSETFEQHQLSESPVCDQEMLDHITGEPVSTTGLEMGDCFTFSDSLLAPYGNDMSTHPVGETIVDYLHPPLDLDPALAINQTADRGGIASSQTEAFTGFAAYGSNNTVGEQYIPDRSTTIESGPADAESPSRLRTLTLENIHPQTINLVLNTLLSSNARFQMRLDNE